MNKIITILFFCLFAETGFSQNANPYSNTDKGQVYILWGWNRAYYTKSNISFKGDDYNFELAKVKAHDRPTAFSYHNYLKIDRITIPQTNFRMGYFIKKDLALTLGFDHMKYVMDQDQTVKMTGNIDRNGSYKGSYNGDKVLTEDFLTFEHTDGLNYINVEVEKYMKIYQSENNKFIVQGLAGGGIGFMMPRTDAKLLDYERNDEFHVAGFGVNSKIGLQLTFFKHLVIKFENKYGYINMPDINLHKKGINGTAKQAFFFTALDGMIGGTFSLNGKKKEIKSK